MNRISRYLYLSSIITDFARDSSGKIRFFLRKDEGSAYINTFAESFHKSVFGMRFSPKPYYKAMIITGSNGELQARVIIELPEYGPARWLHEEALRQWNQGPIADEVVFSAVMESVYMDESFLDPSWTGEIRGLPSA